MRVIFDIAEDLVREKAPLDWVVALSNQLVDDEEIKEHLLKAKVICDRCESEFLRDLLLRMDTDSKVVIDYPLPPSCPDCGTT